MGKKRWDRRDEMGERDGNGIGEMRWERRDGNGCIQVKEEGVFIVAFTPFLLT